MKRTGQSACLSSLPGDWSHPGTRTPVRSRLASPDTVYHLPVTVGRQTNTCSTTTSLPRHILVARCDTQRPCGPNTRSTRVTVPRHSLSHLCDSRLPHQPPDRHPHLLDCVGGRNHHPNTCSTPPPTDRTPVRPTQPTPNTHYHTPTTPSRQTSQTPVKPYHPTTTPNTRSTPQPSTSTSTRTSPSPSTSTTGSPQPSTST